LEKKLRTQLYDEIVDSGSDQVASSITRRVVLGQEKDKHDWTQTGIIYLTDGQADFGGVHEDIKLNTGVDIPFALVGCVDSNWTVVFSHEVLELLADPWGKRMARRPKENQIWIVEVCDPCEADNFAYDIDGVNVSDFILPAYFDDTTTSTTLSFKGTIKKPFTIEKGGYLSYLDLKDNQWYQITWFDGSAPVTNVLSKPRGGRIRAAKAHKKAQYHRLLKYMKHVESLSARYPNLARAYGM